MSDQSQISISIEKSIKSIGKKNWNKCANHDPLNYNPFVSFEFLNALEESKSVNGCLLYTSPSPRDPKTSRMPSSA